MFKYNENPSYKGLQKIWIHFDLLSNKNSCIVFSLNGKEKFITELFKLQIDSNDLGLALTSRICEVLKVFNGACRVGVR